MKKKKGDERKIEDGKEGEGKRVKEKMERGTEGR